MEFNWRILEKGDYENTLVKWWRDWRWTPPPKDMLPQEGTCGIMVSKGDIDVCAGFIYLTNSSTAWVEYIVSNFEYKEKDRKSAIELLIETLSLIAEDKGCKYIFTSLKNNLLMDSYKECGYVVGSTNCTEMIKKV
jgi:hypothetical protein